MAPMRRYLLLFLLAVVCLGAGFGLGVWFGPQITATQSGKSMMGSVTKLVAKAGGLPDDNAAIEEYSYPKIKWRPKPLADADGAIAQLWTTYERSDQPQQPQQPQQPGKLNYRLTVFKAPDKGQCEVQLLDGSGFKIIQFNAGDFHQIPGTADIMEARDSTPITEEHYRQARDYSVK